MKKFLVVFAILMLVGTVAFAVGNKNDLAYLATDELATASAIAVTDGVLITQSGVPKQGVTVSDISKVGVTNVKIHATTDETLVLATDTGKTFIASEITRFQLPAVGDGLTYTFVANSAWNSAKVLSVQITTTPGTIIFAGLTGTAHQIVDWTATTATTVVFTSDGTSWYAFSTHANQVKGKETWRALNMGAQE